MFSSLFLLNTSSLFWLAPQLDWSFETLGTALLGDQPLPTTSFIPLDPRWLMKGFAMIHPREFSTSKTAPGWAEGILKWRSRRARERGNRGKGIFAELQQKREVSFFESFFSILHIKFNLVLSMVGLPGPLKFLLQCLGLKYKIHHSKLLRLLDWKTPDEPLHL